MTWTVDSGNIDIVDDTEWAGATGRQSVNLNGWEPGSMFTDVFLQAGQYELGFAYASHINELDNGVMEVLLNGQLLTGSPFTTTTRAPSFQQINIPFTLAVTGVQRLRFSSLSNFGNLALGPVIDDIRLQGQPVPEPAALAFIGALTGLGFRRIFPRRTRDRNLRK